jgi:hypothetical protein
VQDFAGSDIVKRLAESSRSSVYLEEADSCAADIFVRMLLEIIIKRLGKTNMVLSSTYKITPHCVTICAISRE